MELTDDFLADLTYVRREYHRLPELSKSETATALTVLSQLSLLNPTNVICGIGGTGIVAEFDSGVAGPSVLFRAELDALLITEINSFPHKS
jgi:metal-dependent amidase/aminoacylase/carboxypeptidase family protein